jgi:thiol-disulfide isomerase/thioredoxin
MDWKPRFEAALPYERFLEVHGTDAHRQRWRSLYDQIRLTPDQQALLRGFVRQVNVLCVAGAWCGDCVNQCPILQRFAEATDKIDLRFLDRDAHMDLAQELSICGGNRVPVVVFLSEDFFECGRYGERTLSKYRELGATLLGAACPTGITTPESSLLDTVTAEWLGEFERVQIMLRLSPRLRSRHRD